MEQLPLITHTIHQREIPTLLDSWVTNITSDEILWSGRKKYPYIFVKI